MIVFIGDSESVKPYRLFGFKTYTAETGAEAEEILRKLPGEASAVFITEELFSPGGFADSAGIRPVAVPGLKGGAGAGAAHIKDMLRKALGTEAGGTF
jgi:vacuolar-type H+-ATPase subunit F/Vma7